MPLHLATARKGGGEVSFPSFRLSPGAIAEIYWLFVTGSRRSRRGPRAVLKCRVRPAGQGMPPSLREIIRYLTEGHYVDKPPSPPTIRRVIIRIVGGGL